MSLLDEVQAITAARTHGEPCSVTVILNSLDKADRADLQTVLDSPAPGVHIAQALTNRGHKIRAHTIQRHRNHNCACP